MRRKHRDARTSRDFLDRVVTRIAELDSGVIREYVGGWIDYQDAKQRAWQPKRVT